MISAYTLIRPYGAFEYMNTPLLVDILKQNNLERYRKYIMVISYDAEAEQEIVVLRATALQEAQPLVDALKDAHFELLEAIDVDPTTQRVTKKKADENALRALGKALGEDTEAIEEELKDRREFHERKFGADK